MGKDKRKIDIAVLFGLFVLIFITRIATICVHKYLYLDEIVFNTSAYRLSRFLIGSIDSYVPYKPYPEGGTICQVPLQLVTAVLGKLFHFQSDNRLIGRLTAVCFFTAAVGIGVWLLRKHFPKEKQSVSVFYLLTMLFGIMHIEQSRYGIGNAPTFFFLMLMIALTDSALAAQKHRRIYAILAYMSIGALASIKYPQVYFAVIPFCAFRYASRKEKSRCLVWEILCMMLGIAVGFFFMSPKSLVEPGFIYQAVVRESEAYVGNMVAPRDVLGHLGECLLYISFYSGIPILTFAILLPLRDKQNVDVHPIQALYHRIIPVAVCIFVFYNLFATLFVVRNLYPAIVLCDFYAAVLAAKMYAHGKNSKWIVIFLVAVLCLRGLYYDYALYRDNPYERYTLALSECAPDSYQEVTLLKPGWVAFDDDPFTEEYPTLNLNDERFASEDGFAMQEGECIVATCQEYYLCNDYPFSVKTMEETELTRRWKEFQKQNEIYKVAQFYPRHYYYIFGYWIPGTTGAGMEFPFHVLYLNPASAHAETK